MRAGLDRGSARCPACGACEDAAFAIARTLAGVWFLTACERAGFAGVRPVTGMWSLSAPLAPGVLRRTYNQFCATARTLDLVGERWTLLIVRDLMTGPKRFSDFQNSLRGLGTGLLAARLKHLEREGLVRKITLPAPARTPAYALTEAGAELGPAVLALAR